MNDGQAQVKQEAAQDKAVAPDTLSYESLQPPHMTPSTSKQGEARNAIPSHLYKRLPEHCLLPDGTPDYLRLILTSRVYDLVQPTPLTKATSLSAKTGCDILLKREDLQPVFSFKIRGAYNLMAHLTEEERWKGVVACSAGNHAQGVAMAGRHLGVACTIVMPLNTPNIKWGNVERLGAKVVLHGSDFDEAKKECARLEKVHGLTNIPPFDDPYVIAGQGTSAVEIMRETDPNSLDAVFCCVGGGGLLAGTAAYVKKIAPPKVKVIGVETFDGDALTQSIQAGKRVILNEVGLFSEGTAVRVIGEETFRVCNELVDEMISVSNDEICAAIKDIFDDTRSVCEPAGALAVAGMKRYIQQNKLQGSGKRFVASVSGANINFDRLRFVAERAELGEKREALLSVVIPETPGSFIKLYSRIYPRSVTEFSYRYSSGTRAFIICSFYLAAGSSPVSAGASNGASLSPQEARAQELQEVISTLKSDGFEVRDLSEDELAKSHARYLVGGRANVPNERLFRFEFPERPGALKKFLSGLHAGWNISLFHYRNMGGDLAKILAGIQVPKEEYAEFDSFLNNLGYRWVEETENETYRTFLDEK